MGCTGYSNYDSSGGRDDWDKNSGGCFTGNGKVQLKNKTLKKVKDLMKGDILENGAIVQCLIKIKVYKIIPVVELNSVYYTLKHPIIYEGKWVNPISIKSPKFIFIDNWYNLVLKNGYSVKINGIEAITLGHEQKDEIAYHPYFGTTKVLNDLKKYKEFKSGNIVIGKKLNIKRDENGRICQYF